MQYLIGMLSTFAVISLWAWLTNLKKDTDMHRLHANWDRAHATAARQVEVLENISAILQNGR